MTTGNFPPPCYVESHHQDKCTISQQHHGQFFENSQPKEGLDLVHVGDYRPYEQQLSLFKSRMKPFPDAKKTTQTVRTFNGEKWYLHNGAAVATPGTSNHGWGLAIDAAVKTKGKRGGVVSITTKPRIAKRSGLQFLLAEAPSLGWSWELQSEPWHIRYVAGDKTPNA